LERVCLFVRLGCEVGWFVRLLLLSFWEVMCGVPERVSEERVRGGKGSLRDAVKLCSDEVKLMEMNRG
jgi:hypothetical protein